jgi:hypothetical protein
MAARNITVSDVENALRSENVELPVIAKVPVDPPINSNNLVVPSVP